MAKSSIMVNLDDPRTGKIANAISNATCKKILSLLSEKELSESDIASELKIPINTIEYNLKKLVESGLVEKAKNFFWSTKGKKIIIYKVSNKNIVISPKSMIKGIIPALIISGATALGIKLFIDNKVSSISRMAKESAQVASADSAAMIQPEYGASLYSTLASANLWAWFLMGALVGLLVFLLWNWAKGKKSN